MLEILPFDTQQDRECSRSAADTFLILRGGAEMMRVSTYERAQAWIASHPDGETDDHDTPDAGENDEAPHMPAGLID